MKKGLASIVFAIAAFSAAFADEISWKSADGVLDGSFDDLSHWTGGVLPGLTDIAHIYFNSTLPEQPMTVTMPRGAYTNLATISVGPRIGAPVTIDGLGSELVHPALESGGSYYPGVMFRINAKDTAGYFMHLSLSASEPTPVGANPNLVLSNYLFTVSSEREKQAKVEFKSGLYNFLDPLGHVWTSLPGRPILYLFANGYNYSMPLDETEIVFDEGTSLRAPTLGVTGNSTTNVLRFAGGTHVANSVAMPCISDGQNWNKGRTVTDIAVENGATFTVLRSFLSNNADGASNRLSRVFARNGGAVTFNDIYPGSGEIDFAADGGTLNFGGTTDIHEATNTKFRRMTISATDGGQLSFGSLFKFGGAPRADGLGNLALSLDAAAMTVEETGRFNIYGNAIAAANGSVITNAGAFNLAGGTVDFTSGSCLVNAGAITNAATLALSDSRIENRGLFLMDGGTERTALLCGGVITNTSATEMLIQKATVSNATLVTTRSICFGKGVTDIHSTKLVLATEDGKKGSIRIGNSHYTLSTVNFYGGEITNTYSNTANDMFVGQGGNNSNQGSGVLNVYGGQITVAYLNIANGYSPEPMESVLRLEGGRFTVLCKGNGRGVGLQIAENFTRRGRVILNGGVFKTYTMGPCISSDPTEWAKCHAFFEADGGTLTTPSSTQYLLYGFQEAKVGPKGLTVDNGGYNVTLEQAVIADKDDANGEGRIILKGAGSTMFYGDLSDVSYLVADEGTLVLTNLAVNAETDFSLGSLVSTNGATLKMDPAKTVRARGTVVLDACRFLLTGAVAADTPYDLIHYEQAASQETINALIGGRAQLDAPAIPAGTAAIFEQVEDSEGGGYFLRLTCRPSHVVETLSAESGSSVDTESRIFSRYDRLAVDVAESADLTLTGTNQWGAIDKFGGGILTLGDLGSRYLGGLNLFAGAIVLGDETGTVGDAATTTVLSNGVLKITGPATGVTLPGAFKLAAATSNDVVIIDNDVDVTMAAPSGTPASLHTTSPDTEYGGSFIKRGAGTLTWEVTGASVLPGGIGNTFVGGTFWPYSMPDERCAPFVFDEATGILRSGAHPAFTVYEGCLRLVGRGSGAKLSTSGVVSIGMAGKEGHVQPGLILDNVTLAYTYWANRWMMAPGVYSGSPTDPSFLTAPYLILTNAATYSAYSLFVNRLARSNGALKSTISAFGGSRFTCTTFSPNRCSYSGAAISESEGNFFDSTINLGNASGGGGLELFQPFTLNFDRSVLAGNQTPAQASAAYASIHPEAGTDSITSAYGTFNFRNGSECRVREVVPYEKADRPIAFNFDDSAWIPGAGDFSFAWDDPTKIAITATGGGLKLPVPEEKTWTLAQAVLGSGPVVNSGAGTLKLAAGFDRTTGAVCAEAGATVDLDGAAHAIFAAGAGSFVNGSIAAGGGLAVTVNDAYETGAIPDLAAVSLPANLKVDLGRTEANPLVEPFQPIVVYRYSGTAPDVSGWKLAGTGMRGVRGEFEAQDGVVKVTPVFAGVMLILK